MESNEKKLLAAIFSGNMAEKPEKQLPPENTKKHSNRSARDRRTDGEKQLSETEGGELRAFGRKTVSFELPYGWKNPYLGDRRAIGVFAATPLEGLTLSLSNLGRVDIEYISAITGESCQSVIAALKGSIFQNPEKWEGLFFKGWETSDEYLSGNLAKKWKTAKAANEKYGGYFSDNLKALEKAMPQGISTSDIYITLGSPWVPPDIIDDFILYLFGNRTQQNIRFPGAAVKHDHITGTWEIPCKNRYNHSVSVTHTYGTPRAEALHILEKTLNMREIAVYDDAPGANTLTGCRKVINREETLAAGEKQKKLIEAFKKWVWRDETRKRRLKIIFENCFVRVRQRQFDNSILTFPGMAENVQLYPYQRDAAARIIFSKNVLLAHDVGAGKTYVMAAVGMELLRMGLSTKNMYVVPNNIVGQWRSIFLSMYPKASLMTVEPKDFTPPKRQKVLESIRDGKTENIIIAYSCFEQIPLSKEYYLEKLEEKRIRIRRVLRAGGTHITHKLETLEQTVLKELSELIITEEKKGVCFDQLGVTRLFVDEAHNYKNLPIEAKLGNVPGISSGGSKKCVAMMDKVRFIQKQNNGGGVVMATGTPITNSITDAYVMQRYLQEEKLAAVGLESFTSWAGMFAEKATGFEVDVDTSSYRLTTRFAKFHNLPELTLMLSSIADFHQLDKSAGIPDMDGYNDVIVERSPEFSAYLADISRRAEAVRSGAVSRKRDNMLKITVDGRKAALDMRLVRPDVSPTPHSKANSCAEAVYQIYRQTARENCTQLIFCDFSVPKDGFNMYDEMKKLLVKKGVPAWEIAFIHDAKTDEDRETLFEKMRRGDIRILIGSTFKLGLGVNVQDKLIAAHHLDVPWRPADMTQREGRILRQGNRNKKVYIYRYITNGSFDAYSWQLLETKQSFISSLLSGTLTERSSGDIDDTVLDYAEVKALAIGNPLVKKRVETANELNRFISLQKKVSESRLTMEGELMKLPAAIQSQQSLMDRCQADMEHYRKERQEEQQTGIESGMSLNKRKILVSETRKNIREKIAEAISENLPLEKERLLSRYMGFDILIPANNKEKPCIWLRRKGSYRVELGDNPVGYLIRVDNFLENMDAYYQKLLEGKKNLEAELGKIKEELAKNENYTEKITQLKSRLKRLDRQLGAST